MRTFARPRFLAAPLVALLSVACSDGGDPPVIAVVGGGAYLNAARMAIEDAGLPSTSFDTLLIAETSNRAAPALAVAQRIVEAPGVVAVVGHANSPASLLAAQLYNEAEIVQIAPTSTAVQYSEAGPFSFRLVPSDDHQGPFLAAKLEEAFPQGARIALFYVNDDYGRGLRSAVRGALDPDLFPIGVDLPHLEGGVTEGDVERSAMALQANAPDAILFLARPESLVRYLPMIRAQLPRVPIYGGDAIARALTLPQPVDFWAGVAFSDFVDPEGDERVSAFSQRYSGRHGTEVSGGEVLAYDAVTLLLSGLQAGVRSGPEMQSWLRSLGREQPAFEGLSGTISFDSSGDLEGASYVLRWLAGPL